MLNLVLKAAGALCIMAAAGAFGEFKARALALRVKQLQQFQRSLKLLATEISYSNSVLSFAFQKVAAKCLFPVCEIYLHASEMLLEGSEQSTVEIWRESVYTVYPRSCFTESDRDIIESLGVSLGVSQKDGQLKQVFMTEEHLAHALEAARENREKGEKMWRYLGYLSGAALVILLL